MNISQLFFTGRESRKAVAGGLIVFGFALLSALTFACRSGDGNGEDDERGGSLPDGYTITGQISSSITNALAGAQVELKQDGQTVKTATTGLDGLYAFEGLEDGTFLVEASAAKHTTKATAAFDLSEDKPNIDITLTREWSTPLQGELVAGTPGINGSSSRTLDRPERIAFGPDGDIYIVDAYNNKIRKVRPGNPDIIDVAGTGAQGFANGPLDSAVFNKPTGLCFAPNGVLYVADATGQRVRQITGGEVLTVAGTGTQGNFVAGDALSAYLKYPCDVCFIDGYLYVSNWAGHRILKINGTQIETVAGDETRESTGDGGLAVNARVESPLGLAAGPDGSLYFTEGQRVRKIDTAGYISTVVNSAAGLYFMTDELAIAPDGTFFLTDSLNNRVMMIRDGAVTELVNGGAGTGNGQLYIPVGIVIGPDGYLYVADSGNYRIMRY